MKNEALLLVDDDQLEHLKLKNTFKKLAADCELLSAYNGEEALAYLGANKHQLPKLIILDLNMPKMNGLEFLEIIKDDPLLRRIPVVVLTTSNKEDDRKASFHHQAAGYMVKPDDFKTYQELIELISSYWSTSKLAH